MTLSLFFDGIGFLGVATLLLAFFLVQNEKLSPKDIRSPLLNLAGAVLLLISLCYHWNTASVFFELCWISISLHAIYKITKQTKES
jgi:hypothetical protein